MMRKCILFSLLAIQTSSQWIPQNKTDNFPSYHDITIYFTVPQAEMENWLYRLSSPTSSSYGQYSTNSEIAHAIGTSEDALAAIESHVKASSLSSFQVERGIHRDSLSLHLPISTLENIFETKLIQYQHVHKKDVRVIRPETTYNVPHGISQHANISFIQGLDHFPTEVQVEMATTKSSYKTSKKTREITLPFIRSYYGINDVRYQNQSVNNSLAVFSFLNEVYSEDDAIAALKSVNIGTRDYLPETSSSCKSSHKYGATEEASLDVQFAVGTSGNPNTKVMCVDGYRNNSLEYTDGNQEPFLKALIKLNAMDYPPKVVSISYSDDECAVPRAYADKVNQEFIKAGLKGITIVTAAGDTGVLGSTLSSYCKKKYCDNYVPAFPASSPFVTAVGGTTLDALENEVVATSLDSNDLLITAGGGFSNYFDTPAYQKEAVSSYLSKKKPAALVPAFEKFNSHGRAYPDISALAHNYKVVVNGRTTSMDGTSASTPVVAGIISLLNQRRLENNQPALGFINPLLYSIYHKTNQSGFRDVVSGHNACGSIKQDICCSDGFAAIAGWDPASGLGSIIYSEILPQVLLTEDDDDNNNGASIMVAAEVTTFEADSTTPSASLILVGCVITLVVAAVVMQVQNSNSQSILANHNNNNNLKENLL